MAEDPAKLKARILAKYEDLLEAAFDDDVAQCTTLLKGPPKLPLEPDAKTFPAGTYSPLSEAAAGNAVNAVTLLLERGADPNHRGQYGRTPLYRACFNEHEDVVLPLLEGGADPRTLLPQEFEEVTDDEAEAAAAETHKDDDDDAPPRETIKKTVPREWDPEEVPVPEAIKGILRKWDIGRTFAKIAEKEAGEKEVLKEHAEEAKGLADEEKALENEVEAAVGAWQTALGLRESRIAEHDNAKCTGNAAAAEQLVPLIIAAEASVDALKQTKLDAEARLSHARSRVRQHKVASSGGLKVNTQIGLTALPDVVNDISGQILATGKCACIIDASEKGRSFLKYRNVVIVEVADHAQMQPGKLAEVVLGAVKQGRPLLFDIGGDDSLRAARALLEAVHPTLAGRLLDNSLTHDAYYEVLITADVLKADPGLAKENFPPGAAERFRFMFITSHTCPEQGLLDATYSVLLEA